MAKEINAIEPKGMLMMQGGKDESFADQFYTLAGKIHPSEELACVPAPNAFISRQRDRTRQSAIKW